MSDHLLNSATLRLCENYNQRPEGEISLLVIHNISLPPGEFDNNYIEQFFSNKLDFSAHPYFQNLREIKVSTHLLIKRDGSIIQFVPFDKRAWHAGKSNFNGRENCNDFSIGIELEGTDDLAYTNSQYSSLNATIKVLKLHYPIANIVGHNEISPKRKTDPGAAFDWSKIDENR
ncbi:MAG: 1,6-anhydro-N-acetylmuramyl-L-alanine amidase AmpD [Candidatus Thioglobus sp.]|nr:1,6-anhydro-N-acetylmuramyl-L-alanine amidase AmpD [Candidatus Thioglobus sp.]